MKQDRLSAAEHLSAHAILRGELPPPTRQDRHPFLPFAAYVGVLCPQAPEPWAPDEQVGFEDRLAGLLRSACQIRDYLRSSTCNLTVARIRVERLRGLAADLAARLQDDPLELDFDLDGGEAADRAITSTIRLAQIVDVCLAGCGDRAALARLAETAEACVALGAEGYLPPAVGARALLALPDAQWDWHGGPPLTIIQRALEFGHSKLAQRSLFVARAGREQARAHAEAIEDDRAGLARIPASAPEQGELEPEPVAVPPGHVLVVPRIGGGTKGQSNRDAAAELKGVLGVPLPLYPFPRDRRALVEKAAAEAPHARAFFERLVALQDGREHWALPPVLALGDPGGGKTSALDAFLRGAGVYVERFACDGSSDSAAAGTPRRWLSSEVCLPLRATMTAMHANPAVLWDEINRAGGHRQGSGGTLRDALTSLTEPVNASRYRDPFVEAEVDISHVLHLATANSLIGVAPQVADRFTVLEFPLPTKQHLPVLARRMALDIVRRQGLPDEEGELDRAEIQALSEHWSGGSLRGLKKLVEVAVRARLTAPYETHH